MERMTGLITAMELDAQRVVVTVPQGEGPGMVGGPRSPQAIMPKEKNTVP